MHVCIVGTVNFCFRIHQFAGGYTDACCTLFNEVSAKLRALLKGNADEAIKSTEDAESQD